MEYAPPGTDVKIKLPFSSLVVSRVWFVPVLVRRTVAPVTLLPAVSVTEPMTEPYNTCARAEPPTLNRQSSSAAAKNAIRLRFLKQFAISFLLAIHLTISSSLANADDWF